MIKRPPHHPLLWHQSLSSWFPAKNGMSHQNLKVKVRHFLHEMVLDLLNTSHSLNILPCSEPKLQFHAFKLFLVSYSISALFLTLQINLRFLKLVWNDSPNPKTLVWYQNYVSSMIRTKVTISLHEVVLGLLQTFHPVLGLQIDLRLLKIVSNDSPYPKTFSLIPKLFSSIIRTNWKCPCICLLLCGLPVYR